MNTLDRKERWKRSLGKPVVVPRGPDHGSLPARGGRSAGGGAGASFPPARWVAASAGFHDFIYRAPQLLRFEHGKQPINKPLLHTLGVRAVTLSLTCKVPCPVPCGSQLVLKGVPFCGRGTLPWEASRGPAPWSSVAPLEERPGRPREVLLGPQNISGWLGPWFPMTAPISWLWLLGGLDKRVSVESGDLISGA